MISTIRLEEILHLSGAGEVPPSAITWTGQLLNEAGSDGAFLCRVCEEGHPPADVLLWLINGGWRIDREGVAGSVDMEDAEVTVLAKVLLIEGVGL